MSKDYYRTDVRARDMEVLEWDPPSVNFEFISGVCVQRTETDNGRMQQALSHTLSIIDEGEVTKDEAIALVVSAMGLTVVETMALKLEFLSK